MKTLFILMIAASGFGPSPEQAPVSLDDITRAIGSGNTERVMSFVDAELELSILDEEDIYGKADAKSKLQGFFSKFPPTAFNQRHQGSSKADDAEYVIGNLSTEKGALRVYIYVAKKDNRLLLQELRFERV